MTRLVFLSPTEKRKFDSPPTLTKDQRPAYFVVSEDIKRTLSKLRSNVEQVAFSHLQSRVPLATGLFQALRKILCPLGLSAERY